MQDAMQRPSERIETTPGGSRRTAVGRWTWFIAVALVLGAVAAVLLSRTPTAPAPAVLSYSELVQAVEAGEITALVIEPGQRIRGLWAPTAAHPAASAGAGVEVVYPLERMDALLERAAAAGVEVSFERRANPQRGQQFVGFGLMALLLAGFALLVVMHLRSQTGGGGGVGRKVDGTQTTFADVAGTQGAAEELRELVDFLRRPATFTELGARVPKGVLLVGPPGTGKTLLARAVAGEAGVPFYQVSGAEVTGFVVGLGAHRIRSLFKKARKKGGVVFIDEIDSLGGTRGRNRSHNEDDRTLNQLLVEMDGFAPSEGVVVVGATNRPEDLDRALKRPGRFDRIVTVGLPTVDGREAILRLHAEKRRIPLADDVDLRRLARLTPMASGAELANLLNEAAIAAARERSSRVRWADFETARDRMLLGKERVGFRAREQELRIVAYHEAGHALAGVLSCPEDGLHKVTIQPRGRAMGVAHFSPDDDRHLHSRRYLEGQIVKGLAGRAAEEAVFGPDHITGGAESDLLHVNRIARRMVFRLGMGETNGLLIHDEEGGPLSPEAQAALEAEVRALLARKYDRARELVTTHRGALDALAEALLAQETLDGEAALRLLEAHGVRPEPVAAA